MKQWYIAIAFAVVYLAVSFAFNCWAWSWVIWFAYAGYRLYHNKRTKGEQ